jgi:enterochelin esterase-like enzyme
MIISDAFVVVPGGIGTLLEMSIAWQLPQVQKLYNTPLILVGKMWDGLVQWAEEFTKPGYELYARSLIEEVVPEMEKTLRVLHGRRYRSVWGSSLGGVVSFYTVWQYPEMFGAAICMSSTFSYRDDLLERVLT